MMHKNKNIIFICVLIFIILSICFVFRNTNKETKFANEQFQKQETKTEYIKLQNKISMDWDFIDEEFLLKLAQYKGGSIEDKAYNILVTLNIVYDTKKSIKDVTLKELYDVEGLTSYDWEEIIPDDDTKEAMRMIIYDKFDNSNGSTIYRNGDE